MGPMLVCSSSTVKAALLFKCSIKCHPMPTWGTFTMRRKEVPWAGLPDELRRLPQDKIRRSMELFTTEVMPHFRDA